jgi:ketosteroid isomerase-like protein
MLQRLAVSLILMTSSAMAQSSPQPAPKAAEALIRAARARSNRAIAERNLNTFADSLDKDFVAVVGDGSFVSSRAIYVSLFQADFADPHTYIRYERAPDTVDISLSKPLAAEHGHWTGFLPDGSVAYTGTYMASWRRGPAGWKIRSELFVTLTCAPETPCTSAHLPPNAGQ